LFITSYAIIPNTLSKYIFRVHLQFNRVQKCTNYFSWNRLCYRRQDVTTTITTSTSGYKIRSYGWDKASNMAVEKLLVNSKINTRYSLITVLSLTLLWMSTILVTQWLIMNLNEESLSKVNSTFITVWVRLSSTLIHVTITTQQLYIIPADTCAHHWSI